jgi:nitrate/TMAO reductase-like tetraheme cytochrome c subunit
MFNKLNKINKKKVLVTGLAGGVLISLITVLASGFMVEVTNTDSFCVSCHAMVPFRASWTDSVHGGQNPKGLTAQCVDCHLPHGNFTQYLVTKAITGTGDVLQNLVIDAKTFDWEKNAEERRHIFTYDSACRHCHNNLTPPGLKRGGLLAHRAYLIGETKKQCSNCHPNVGHKNMIETAKNFFAKESK